MTQHGARALGRHCRGFRLVCFPLPEREEEGREGGREGGVQLLIAGGKEGGKEGGEEEGVSAKDLPPPVFASPHHNTRTKTYAYIEGR